MFFQSYFQAVAQRLPMGTVRRDEFQAQVPILVRTDVLELLD